ncbi:conserved hypothetical protein, partial [Listeria ivanovii FSL F6-596]
MSLNSNHFSPNTNAQRIITDNININHFFFILLTLFSFY